MSHEAFCYNSPWLYIWIWMADVAESVNRPLFFLFQCFVVVQVLIAALSKFTALVLRPTRHPKLIF